MLTSQEQAGSTLDRPRWYGRQIVGPDDLTQEQDHVRARQRRHNRMLHGWGVVCGLRVRSGETPCELIVEAGYALDPCGEEIVVSADVSLDACSEDMDGAAVSPCGGDPWCGSVRIARDPDTPYYLAIRYVERLARPVLAYGDCCATDPACEYSRRSDGFELRVLDTLPPGHDAIPRSADLVAAVTCAAGPRVCPACPDSDWVVLADLRIQSDTVNADCFPHRRYAVSLADLYFGCTGQDSLVRERPSPGDTTLSDLRAGAVAEAPAASVAVRLPQAGMRTLPVYFDVHAGETFADLIAREGGREYVADTGEKFTLADVYAMAAVNPRETVRSVTDALRPLEALAVRPEDLEVTRRALDALVDDGGLARLAAEHADAPAQVAELPATDLMGLSERGALARSLAGLTVGDVAGRDRDQFVDEAAARARGAARQRLREQADEVWVTADRVRRIAAAWVPS